MDGWKSMVAYLKALMALENAVYSKAAEMWRKELQELLNKGTAAVPGKVNR